MFQEDPNGFPVYDRSEIQNGALFSESSNLIVGTAADTVGKLTVGTNGYFLKADSTTATGLAWAQVDLSSYATTATVENNLIMNIMGAI